MQLGFVIDHSRCIGCHACTVACKSENDVPLGRFRTWVKYTEQGEFPEVRRSFAVLRCNQCTSAPCVTICPVRALHKRPDGIVDIDPAACIGCKACMQGCPYDALYLNPATGTAEKCHFCAHRVERGLAPACAVVCPTEAIVPGDLDDPASVVARLRERHELSARKVEAGTGPNVWYRDAAPAGIDPSLPNATGGFLWAGRMPGVDLDAERFEALERDAEERAMPRTTYTADHAPYWRGKVSAYLFTKSLAAGLFLVLPLLMRPFLPDVFAAGSTVLRNLALGAVAFLLLTTFLLVADLKRPARFLYILVRPNWGSWLARGSLVLIGYGGLLSLWVLMLIGREDGAAPPATGWLTGLTWVLGALAAGYTGWLFAQARGRVLWMRRGLWLHLIVQAWTAGAAAASLAHPLLDLPVEAVHRLRWGLVAGLALHLLFTFGERFGAPAGRRDEYRRALRLVTHGPYSDLHLQLGLGAGVLIPALVLLTPLPPIWPPAAGLVLLGLYVEEDVLVRAGQALPVS